MLLTAAIERLYDLNVGITPLEEGAPHEKPHKPLLLLAAFDLIDEGLATPDRIPWCQEIRDRSLAIAHGHEQALWEEVENAKGKLVWRPKKDAKEIAEEMVRQYGK